MLVSLFITCYNDTLFPETGKAVVAVLERLGHRVEFRAAQTCCGQMHYNTGYAREARPMMVRFLELFGDALDAGVDAICVPSASCVAMIREQYPRMTGGDAHVEALLAKVLPHIYEFSELLVDKCGVEDVGASFPHTVTLHPSCHSLRSLKVGDKPDRLLRRVRGLTLIELPDREQCCGFGGTFAIKNADVSGAMLAEKIQAIASTQAEVCTAGDNSCLMQIFGALHRERMGVRTLHLAEILASTENAE